MTERRSVFMYVERRASWDRRKMNFKAMYTFDGEEKRASHRRQVRRRKADLPITVQHIDGGSTGRMTL